MKKITQELLTWYEENKRDLPWRHTKNPYYIWISEIMLQQTQVETVKEYYQRFIKKLPTLEDLANISQDELLKLWEGLGYYSRVRNMQKTAQLLIKKQKKTLPNTKEALIKLPGIGDYTAGAILSIAFDKPSIAIDGNVYRILGRVYRIHEPINKKATYKKYEEKMTSLLPTTKSSAFTQSFMDLGSLICTPKNPKCEKCPLSKECEAKKHQEQEQYPVKEKKLNKKMEERSVFLLTYKDKIAIKKREEKGLLASLYEFPNTLKKPTIIDIENDLIERNIPFKNVTQIGEAKHIFSHKIWSMKGFYIELLNPIEKFLWVTKEELKSTYPLPSAFIYFYDFYINHEK